MVGYVTIEIILASRRHQLREAREASLLVNSALEITAPDAGNASESELDVMAKRALKSDGVQ